MEIKKLNTQDKFGKIGVLMGGPSTEREVSLKSGKAVYAALQGSDIEVAAINVESDNREENIHLLKTHNIDCAFIALHGRFGEDGQIQEILDGLGIPYTGSGSLASKLAMDKTASRKIFEAFGLTVPRYKELYRLSCNLKSVTLDDFNFPLVVKPATHGSSIGLSIVDKKEDLNKAIGSAFNFDERILVEEYIAGREVTVGILDDKPLPVIEIIPKRRFFDYEAKYHSGMTEYKVPAELEEATAKMVQSIAVSAHKLLGCFGCSRVDMILSSEDIPFILEVNSIPGFTPTSLLPKAAKIAGIEFNQLCLRLIRIAYEKTKVKSILYPDKVAGFTV